MKKRNKIIAGLVALLAGSGLALAGSGSCGYEGKSRGGWGHGGGHHGPMLERMIGKLDHHLDLSDQQRASLEQVLEQNSDSARNHRQQRRALRHESMQLDPSSDTYDAQTQDIAGRIAEMARDQALLMANVYKQVSQILTDEQREEMRELMQRRMEKMERRMQQQAS